MMNLSPRILAALTTGLLSTTALSADFTVEELHRSSQEATKMFKDEFGEERYNSIYGIQVTKGRESGRVKLFYRHNEQAQTIEYFCHYHGADSFDCHVH